MKKSLGTVLSVLVWWGFADFVSAQDFEDPVRLEAAGQAVTPLRFATILTAMPAP